MTPFLWKIVLCYIIWRHCSIATMQLAIHSRVTDCARCMLPNNYAIVPNSLPNYNEYVRNNINEILPNFCNIFFFERFTLSMDPILIVLLKLTIFRQKSGGATPMQGATPTHLSLRKVLGESAKGSGQGQTSSPQTISFLSTVHDRRFCSHSD